MRIGITMDLSTAERQHHNVSSPRPTTTLAPSPTPSSPRSNKGTTVLDPASQASATKISIRRPPPGHDGGTTGRWHFHPIVVPARGLEDCAEFITEAGADVGEFMPRHDVNFAPLRNDRYTDVGTPTPTVD